METTPRCALHQPFVGLGTALVALCALGACWSVSGPAQLVTQDDTGTVLLALCLIISVVVAYRFPIYIRHNTKLCVFTVPLYLMAVFLDPPVAAAAAGLSILSGELVVRSRHGNLPCDVATHAGRWVIVILLGSEVAHAPLPVLGLLPHSLLLLATGVSLFVGDILTAPLALAPICDESLDHLMLTLVREGGPVEGGQYVLGIAMALAMQTWMWTFPLFAVPVALVYLLSRPEMDADTSQLLKGMADAVDLRDPYTVEHSVRVCALVAAILKQLGRNGQEAAVILAAARVHDIGKLQVPDHILLKRGELTEEERALMETHAPEGSALLQRYPAFARVAKVVRHHHERWDGTGYPDRLRGAEIPFGARIIAVAETVETLTHDRAYRSALPLQRVAEILRAGRGRQWDPFIVDAFLDSLSDDMGQPHAVTPVLSMPEGPETVGVALTA